jgi:arginase
MSKINLIGYASGDGARITTCEDAPDALQRGGLADYLNKRGLSARWSDIYHSPLDNTEPESVELVKDYCTNLCKNVSASITNDNFPVSLGGDHSMAIGTWSGVTSALHAQGEFGLIWFDAHMDSHTPNTSHSGAIHGMPLACLLGHGDEDLRNIGGSGAKLKPEHVCLIGIRSYEEEEAKLLETLGVRVFFMQEIRDRGLTQVINEALQIVKTGTKGYGVTIDIDVLDPEAAPATGSLEPNGLLAAETFRAVKHIGSDPDLKALEIAEYNPNLDNNGDTAKLIYRLLTLALAAHMR